MREKKWTDCPACGAKRTMRRQVGLREEFSPLDYPPVEVAGLGGQFCKVCGDGFWSLASERKIARALAARMARCDSAPAAPRDSTRYSSEK